MADSGGIEPGGGSGVDGHGITKSGKEKVKKR
jgi:hypothetical protein